MNRPFRIVFMGTPEFAVESLKRLHESEIEVAAVVTVADKPAGRGQKLRPSAVKQYATEAGIPVLQPLKLKSPEFLAELSGFQADLFVIVAFRMLPEVVWNMPPLGSINLHGSLLPQYRGAAPIHWAVINGERETGCTTFFLRHEIDTGAIIEQCKVPIHTDDTTGDVHDRMMIEGAALLLNTVRNIRDKKVTPTDQEHLIEGILLKEAPKLSKERAQIDWTLPASTVHNFIRGLSPFPTAWTKIGGEPLRVFKSKLTSSKSDRTPGTLFVMNRQLFVTCGDGNDIEIEELQMPGKKRMTAAAFLLGNTIEPVVLQ